jgi:short-subunit dehydrogenase
MIRQAYQPAVAVPRQQRVFITGASSGIGLALARHYAQQGAVLGLVARRGALLQPLLDQLGNDRCAIYATDVSSHTALSRAAEDFMQRFGTPDIVIASAGVSRGTLTEYKEDSEAFKDIFAINVFGLVHTFQPFIRPMQQAGHGQLVGIASVAGIRGLPGAGAYSASKAAAITYLESLRVEMIPSNIQVTTIAPGYIRTPMTDINQYRMPFLMDVDIAAAKFAQAIRRKRRFVVIPWQMGVVARIMRLIPAWLWDKLAKDAPHKSRQA